MVHPPSHPASDRDAPHAPSEREPAAARDAPLGSWRTVYLLVALFAAAWILLLWWLTDAFNVRMAR